MAERYQVLDHDGVVNKGHEVMINDDIVYGVWDSIKEKFIGFTIGTSSEGFEEAEQIKRRFEEHDEYLKD